MQQLNICVLYKLIQFASNCLHSKTHLFDEPKQRVVRRESAQHLASARRSSLAEQRILGIFSSPTGEALKSNGLEMAVE